MQVKNTTNRSAIPESTVNRRFFLRNAFGAAAALPLIAASPAIVNAAEHQPATRNKADLMAFNEQAYILVDGESKQVRAAALKQITVALDAADAADRFAMLTTLNLHAFLANVDESEVMPFLQAFKRRVEQRL